ncbi:hypothetical protein F5888DRAFT_1893304 [Russula emetica]|nr:hypothetical protein F5888DRAFT_1893304 [Russula emetica]
MARSRRASAKTQLAYFLHRFLSRAVGHLSLAHTMYITGAWTCPRTQPDSGHWRRIAVQHRARPWAYAIAKFSPCHWHPYCLADGEEDWDSFYVNFFADRDVFMRFRGGGVGHLGTHYLDSRLKRHNNESGYEEQHEATVDDMYEDSNSHPHEEWGNDIEEDSGTHEERTSWRKPINEEDEDVDEDEDTDNEQEVGQHGQRARPR